MLLSLYTELNRLIKSCVTILDQFVLILTKRFTTHILYKVIQATALF